MSVIDELKVVRDDLHSVNDCTDNDGHPYMSQWLADRIATIDRIIDQVEKAEPIGHVLGWEYNSPRVRWVRIPPSGAKLYISPITK